MKRIPKRVRHILLHAAIIVSAVLVIQLAEHLFHLYLSHVGTELAGGSLLSHLIIAANEKTEVVAEVTEAIEEVRG